MDPINETTASSKGSSPQLPSVDDGSTSHRHLFNLKAFHMHPDLTFDKEPGKTSMKLTPTKWQEIMDTLSNWGPLGSDDNFIPEANIHDPIIKDQVLKHRTAHKSGYVWSKVYRVENYTEPNSIEVKMRLKRTCAKGRGRVSLPMHQVFDAIVDAHHRKSAHSGRDVTWDILQESFYNITQDDVLMFLKYCPACLRQNVHTKKLPGAKNPIASTVKRKRQDVQAGKMTDRRAKFASDTGVGIGAIVRVSNDKRDVQNPRSTIAVVVEVAKAGSVLVFADGGIVVHGTKRKELWVDSDMYEVLARSDEEVVSSILTTELNAVRTEILDGTFDRTKYGTATRNEEQKKFLGISPVKASKGCGCGKTSKLGKTCTMACACFKSQRGCTSKCYCNGNCLMNTYNNN
jgi:hypothetical protein